MSTVSETADSMLLSTMPPRAAISARSREVSGKEAAPGDKWVTAPARRGPDTNHRWRVCRARELGSRSPRHCGPDCHGRAGYERAGPFLRRQRGLEPRPPSGGVHGLMAEIRCPPVKRHPRRRHSSGAVEELTAGRDQFLFGRVGMFYRGPASSSQVRGRTDITAHRRDH